VEPGFFVTVSEIDPDYIGIEMRAATSRYAGSAFIYDPFELLPALVAGLSGFPSRKRREVFLEFGSREDRMASGYCGLQFRATSSRICTVDAEFVDAPGRHGDAAARFSFHVEPAAVDRFVQELRQVQAAQIGTATLALSD
jgi:hypothetical protein